MSLFKHNYSMAQTATIYKLQVSAFLRLSTSEKGTPPWKFAISDTSFPKTFMALEYLINKATGNEHMALVREIFTPSCALNHVDFNVEEITDDLLNAVDYVLPFIPPSMVTEINNLLETISASAILDCYRPEELNANHIYPEFWLTEHITILIPDFEALKDIFRSASENEYYLLSTIE
ncbi:DUF1877 family protein [Chitinophaga sp. Cy-1792]|uniref:DUF1877 family protein n=1 Tax=Chitinophaga sp. Cy-1792 TaxID=2608339 RepID=UPI001421AB3B|nr:DUF1877 family protein [Chitinophaga sp. Cy-1792]